MKCPYCSNSEDKVVDSREAQDGTAIRRRRECTQCCRRYTTYEYIEGVMSLKVIKKDGSRETFDRQKALGGIVKALEKRPVSVEAADKLVCDLENSLFSQYDKEVSTSVIGEFIMQRLEELDHIAYVRFASVYREFKDIDQFLKEVETLVKKKSVEHRKKRR